MRLITLVIRPKKILISKHSSTPIKMQNPTEEGLSEDDFENNDVGIIWMSHIMEMFKPRVAC